MIANRRRRLRWGLGAGSGVMVVAGALSLATGPGAAAAVTPGQGNSYAQLLQVTPHEGSLAVGAVLGEALAGHTQLVARAQSQGLDLGSVGLSLQGYNCKTAPSATQVALVPQPLQAETGQPGAAQGQTQTPTTGVESTSPSRFPPSFGSTEFVRATGAPYGEAITSYTGENTPVFSLAGMIAKSWSGVVNGQREAGATADIGSLGFVNDTVVLKGLHWESLYPSGGSARPTGSFHIGGVVFKGVPLNLPASPAAAVSLVNTLLNNFGIQMGTPTVSLNQGVETVTPLEIRVVPNAARDMVVNAILNGTHPAINPVLSGLENGFGPWEPAPLTAALCQSDTPITVTDITLASLDGAGFFSAGFGGVHATSAAVAANPYHLNLPSFSLPGSNQFIPGTQALPGTPGTPGVPAVAATPGTSQAATALPSTSGGAAPTVAGGGPTASSGSNAAPRDTAAAVGHAPGGPLLAIGLGGLGLLAMLAEGDRRMMRRAQHTVNFDNFEE